MFWRYLTVSKKGFMKDQTGRKFGRLTIISLHERSEKSTMHKWLCQCTCGKTVVTAIQNLRTGNTRSCGCLFTEAVVKRNTKHGLMYDHKGAYRSWKDLRQRCNNPNNASYNSYGGRGIHIYPAWEKDFKAFYEYIGEPPNYTERWSIERIDNSKGYEPNNIKWALPKEQASNKRTNIWVSHDGKELTIEQWADLLGISSTTIIKRRKDGKSVEDVLKPRNPNYKQQIPYEGSMYTLKELSILTGVPYQTVWYRHSKGLPVK